MNAVLSASNEAPPGSSTSAGEGFGVFNVDTVNNRMIYDISYSGLLSESAAHIHGFAAAGSNAAVKHGLPAGSPKYGVWNYAEADQESILNELTYVNIHNPEFPRGAIRGQIVRISVNNCALPTPTPTPTATPTATQTPTPTATPTATRDPNKRPDLTLDKESEDHHVRPGERVVFKLEYENRGNAPATGVVIREIVPLNSRFSTNGSSAGWSCANNAGPLSVCEFNVGTVNAGSDGRVRFAVTAASANQGPPLIINVARILDDGTHGLDRKPNNNYGFDVVVIRRHRGHHHDDDDDLNRGAQSTTTLDGATVTVTAGAANAYDVSVTAGGDSVGTRSVIAIEDSAVFLPMLVQ